MKTIRYTALITTIMQDNNEVGFVVKGDSQERHALVMTTPVAFRWPQEGETWLVRKENDTWYLDSPLPSDSFASLPPGDAAISTPTGIVHVVGTPDSSSDYVLLPVGQGQTQIAMGGGNSGSVVVTHNLPFAPSSVTATLVGSPSTIVTFGVDTITDTHFTLYALSTGALGNIAVFWQAIL